MIKNNNISCTSVFWPLSVWKVIHVIFFFSHSHPTFTFKLFFLQMMQSCEWVWTSRKSHVYKESKNKWCKMWKVLKVNCVYGSRLLEGYYESSDNNPVSPSVSVIWASHKHERWAARITQVFHQKLQKGNAVSVWQRLQAQPASRHKRAVWASKRRTGWVRMTAHQTCCINMTRKSEDKTSMSHFL